jgi:hypothetical protein
MGISLRNYLRPNVTNISLTIGIAILLWTKQLSFTSLPYETTHTLIDGLSTPLSIWLSLITTLASGYIFFMLTEKFNFIQNRTYLPFILYILFSSSQPDFWIFSNGKVAFLLLLLSLWEILSTYHKHEPTKLVFNAALLLSVGILIAPDYIILLPFIFISLFIINNLSLRILHAIALGIATPILLLGGIFYLQGTLEENVIHYIQAYQIEIPIWDSDKLTIIYQSVLFILSLVAIRGCLVNRFQSNINERKNLQVMIWLYFFLSVLIAIRMGKIADASTAFSGLISFFFAIFFSINTSQKNTLFFLTIVVLLIAYNLTMSYARIS